MQSRQLLIMSRNQGERWDQAILADGNYMGSDKYDSMPTGISTAISTYLQDWIKLPKGTRVIVDIRVVPEEPKAQQGTGNG